MTFEAILADHSGMLMRIVASYEANPQLQQELMQEVALALWQALPRFRGEGSIKAFVARVAQNRCITHVGREAKRPRQTELYDALPADHESAEEALSQAQRREALMQAVRDLPLNLRQVTTLALEGFSHREIAETLGISENNAMVRFSRAKTALKSAMTADRGKQDGC